MKFLFLTDPRFRFLYDNDSGHLQLISVVGTIAIASVVLMRWFHHPMSTTYWLVASSPLIAGTLLGLYQIYYFLWILGRNGLANPLSPTDAIMLGVFTIHYGVLWSAGLYVINLVLHGWEMLTFRFKRTNLLT